MSTESKLSYNRRCTEDKDKIQFGIDSQLEAGLARSSFKYRASGQWNITPQDIQQSEIMKIFKPKLSKWVLENVPIT